MARTPSSMLALGTKAFNFSLPDTEGRMIALSDFPNRPLLVMFICNHCPYVVHIRAELAKFTREFMEKGLAVVGVNSNDASQYPDDSPKRMVTEKKTAGYCFSYLFDESQAVARGYQATCTPDFFLFDSSHQLVYRGQFDDSRPSNGIDVTGLDLRLAAEALLTGKKIASDQKPSLGCNIKWKS